MRRRLPPLNALRLFEAAARLHSFKNAAEELRLTPSAVSHGINVLEEWIGTPLFQRTARGLVITKTGSEYLPVVVRVLDNLSAASDHVSGRHPADLLTISAAPTIAKRWLLPRLPDFCLKHPSLRIKIDTQHHQVDLLSNEADVAIRLGRGDWPGCASDFILREELVPVCAPSKRVRFEGLANIEDAPLIHVVSASSEWSTWARHALRDVPSKSKGLCFDSIFMAFEAAVQGLGVALGRRPFVDDEFSDNRLVPIWGRSYVSDTSYWLVVPDVRADDWRVAAFRSWLKEQALVYQLDDDRLDALSNHQRDGSRCNRSDLACLS